MDIKIGDVPGYNYVPLTSQTFPGHTYTAMSTQPVAVLATLTAQDKEALRTMIREVVAEAVNEVLDGRECKEADEEKPRDEYWRF